MLYSLVNISDTRGARGRDETDHEGDKIGDLYTYVLYHTVH